MTEGWLARGSREYPCGYSQSESTESGSSSRRFEMMVQQQTHRARETASRILRSSRACSADEVGQMIDTVEHTAVSPPHLVEAARTRVVNAIGLGGDAVESGTCIKGLKIWAATGELRPVCLGGEDLSYFSARISSKVIPGCPMSLDTPHPKLGR